MSVSSSIRPAAAPKLYDSSLKGQTLRGEVSEANHQKPPKNSLTVKAVVQNSPPVMICPSPLAQTFSSWVQWRVGVWVSGQMRVF